MKSRFKINMGTVFSGIGAVEWSLKRMGIDHNLMFACDNGEINIDLDYNRELENIRKLSTPSEKNNYVKQKYKEKTKKTNFVELTYKSNYPIKEDDFYYDVRLMDGNDYRDKIDLFVGGSPCQSFSIAGARGGFEDTRGTLFYDYVRLVSEIRPKVFIYENVYGVLTHDKGKTWRIMQNVFRELGYHYKWKILDARNYGIPQGRRRLFVVGFLDENCFEKFEFPVEIELKYKMQDFLLDNSAFGNFLYDDKGDILIKKGGQSVDEKLFLSDLLLKYVMSPGTKNFYHEDADIDLPVARAILSTQGNSHRSSVNNYVTTNGRIRALDPRESLRLMGFTDDFKITVSKTQSYKQSGNSIVVDVMMAVVKNIFKAMDWCYGEN